MKKKNLKFEMHYSTKTPPRKCGVNINNEKEQKIYDTLIEDCGVINDFISISLEDYKSKNWFFEFTMDGLDDEWNEKNRLESYDIYNKYYKIIGDLYQDGDIIVYYDCIAILSGFSAFALIRDCEIVEQRTFIIS